MIYSVRLGEHLTKRENTLLQKQESYYKVNYMPKNNKIRFLESLQEQLDAGVRLPFATLPEKRRREDIKR